MADLRNELQNAGASFLLRALLSGGKQLPPLSNTIELPKDIGGRYYWNPEQIVINQAVPPSLRSGIIRHEAAHALQNRTIGMESKDPVDISIKQRLGIQRNEPGIGTNLQELLAQYVGNQQGPGTPLESMVMRSLTNRIFNRAYGR